MRDRDFQQALLAVGQRRGRLVHDVEQMEARQVLRDLGIDVVAGAHPPPPVAAAAETFRHREPDGLERRQIGVELVDLEGARQAAQHPRMHRQIGDVAAFEQDAPGIGLEHAGQQVDDGGLAGAVRADQRVAGALFDLERKIAGDLEAAELLFQPSGFQRERHGASLSGTATTAFRPANCRITRFGTHSTQRCRRWRPTSTITTSTRPIQNCQYCGVSVGKHFLQHPEHHRADQAAIKIAGAADHQHQHQVGRALERKHVERGQRVGLGEQRAGDAGIERGQRIDRDQAAVDGNADRGGAQRVVADRAQRQAERRMHDPPRQQEQQEQHGERVEEADLAEHVECEQAEDRLHLDALQPVGTAGDVRKALRQRLQQQRDSQRHHQPGEIDAPDHQEAGEKAEHRGGKARDDQRQHRFADDAVQRQQPGRIGADPEERGMAERNDAGVAEDQIERQRKQRQPHDVGHDQIARGKQRSAQASARIQNAISLAAPARVLSGMVSDVGWRGHHRRQRAAVRPNRPFGRQIRITIMMV